jgi:hypothetical protein
MPAAGPEQPGQAPAFARKEEPPRIEPRTEAQLREDQRREALARRDEAHAEEPRREELRAAPFPAEAPPRVEEPRSEAESRPQPEPTPEVKIDSKALLESSGLVMIETDRAKAPPVQPQVEEPQHLGRPRRERAKPQTQEEQLEQVETRK